MTQVSKPKPDQSRTPQKVEDCTILQLGNDYYHAQTFDGGESYFTTVEAITTDDGRTIHAIWEEDWVEIAPGIRSKVNTLEIQSSACPVLIAFKRRREGRTWNRHSDDYDYHSANDYYQIRYEAK
jgi:hypothetical protein